MELICIGISHYLNQRGITVQGILDDSAETAEFYLDGTIPVVPVSALEKVQENPFFLITSCRKKDKKRFAKRISEQFGSQRFLDVSDLPEVRIDISGKCNLRCPSCQVTNHDKACFSYQHRGFMELPMLERILEKLGREFPDLPAICFFALGEPLLHPQISDAVRLAHEKGYPVILSSNLSLRTSLDDLIESEPEILKISVSGWSQEIYQTTHTGGNIALVKRNMETIARLIDAGKKKSLVIVGYHIYNNNQQEEMEQMEALCREYGFLFQPVRAMYCNMLKKTGHSAFLPEEEAFIRRYYDNAEGILHNDPISSGCAAESTCRIMQDRLYIDYDGTVMLCELFHKDARFKPYLETSPKEIAAWKNASWICKRCMEYDMHLK